MKSSSIFTAGLLFSCALNTAAQAADSWPKEFKDHFTTGCVAQLIGGIDISGKSRKAIGKVCSCMSDGYEKIVPAERFEQASGLTLEEQDALPENDQMRQVIDACNKKFNLDTILATEAQKAAKKPVAQKVREEFLLHCAINFSSEAEDLDDGSSKLSAACTCVADDLLPKMRTLTSDEAQDAEFAASWSKCRKKHMGSE